MPIVVVAEKPSVARDIARVMGARRKGEGFLEGQGYVITWALGHLVEFAEPDEYGAPWNERWSFAQLPIIPDPWKLRLVRRTAAQYTIVKKLINAADTSRIICATDAGREGENIFRLMYEHARCTRPVQRLWISSLTDTAIRAGFERLQDSTDFDPLAAAARIRAQADWLVGMNLTRAYTVHNKVLCTIGRVQTPALAMLVQRDEQIVSFRKEFYYELVARLREGFKARYSAGGETRIDSREKAEQLHRTLSVHTRGTVQTTDSKDRRHHPPPLFDLNSLQREANRRFGFTAAATLKHAQALYETHKLISYPRTESRHIPEDMVPELPGILQNLEHPQAETALRRLRQGHRPGKGFVDRTRLTDHHAIIPTGQKAGTRLAPELKRIYDLVCARFVAVFLPDQIVRETAVELDIGGATFVARGSIVRQAGWTVVERQPRSGASAATEQAVSGGGGGSGADRTHTGVPDGIASEADDREAMVLAALRAGQEVHVDGLEVLEKETRPPRPHTDATLLLAMRNAGRQIEDEELAAAMKHSGLGTPATRAETIEKLIRSGYVRRERRQLRSTDKGRALIAMVAEPLRSPELTATWEQQLQDVEEGKLAASEYYQRITAFVQNLVPQVAAGQAMSAAQVAAARQQQPGTPQRGRKRGRRGSVPRATDLGKCPVCQQGDVVETPRAYGCSRYREGCGFTIWKSMAQRQLPRKTVQQLIQTGSAGPMEGFTARSGKAFSARLRLDSNGKVEFVFEGHARPSATLPTSPSKKSSGESSGESSDPNAASRRPDPAVTRDPAPPHPAVPVAGSPRGRAGGSGLSTSKPSSTRDGRVSPAAPPAGSRTDSDAGATAPTRAIWPPCPRCGHATIIEGQRGYGCSRYREGCSFVVWKVIAGKKLTENQVRTLIGTGRTRIIRGFRAEDGRRYAARLRLDVAGTVVQQPVDDA